MTTLTAGQSASLTIDAGQSLAIVSSSNNEGSVTLAPTVPADVSDAGKFPIGPPAMTKTFGPYASPVTATVACTVGSIAYTLAGNPLVRAATDAGTGAVTLSAGGVNLGGIGQTFTWATKPLASALTGQIFISDVGIGGSYWYSDGSKWRPVGGRVTLKNTITDITNNASPKVVLDYANLPAGLWLDGDVIEVQYLKERTGGTADTDATDIMLGTVAATPGTSTGMNTSALATTNITLYSKTALRKESATTIRPQAIAGSTGLGASSVANTVVTVADMDAQTTYLQITSDLTTAGGEVVHLREFLVTLISGS